MKAYPTPHINASPSDFAETVLMPGDPQRSRFVAENFLEGARLVNDVRGVQGYTGTYRGLPVSVMASGMGMPSMGIYSHELFHIFGVENIVRIGSAGAMQENLKLLDVVIAMGACTDSDMAKNFHLPGTFSATASFELLRVSAEEAEKAGIRYQVGNVLSSDLFYRDEADLRPEETGLARWSKMGVLAVEMEAAALYMNAARLGKRALALASISDHLITGENTSSETRRTAFSNMILLALNSALRF